MGSISTDNQNTAVIKEGVTILTSSRNTETSAETSGQGLFTALLIEALAGRAADVTGYVTPSGVYSYIDKALGPWEQRPVFKTNVTRFVSLRKVNPRISLESLRRLTKRFQGIPSALWRIASLRLLSIYCRKSACKDAYYNNGSAEQ